MSNDDAGSVATFPGKPGDDSARFGPRRARLPRSKSTSNMLDDISLPSETTEEQLRDAVREQIDKDSLRALAKFLRTTEPPPDPSISHDECFGFTGPRKKFSSGSLRRGRKSRWPSQSAHGQFPKNVIPETTAAGHRHIAIMIPTPTDSHGPWFRSQYPVYGPTTPGRPTTSPAEWPERSSSKNAFTTRVRKQGSLGSLRRGPSISSMSSSSGEVSTERSMSSLSITRPASAKPSLNPVDECHESPQESHSPTPQSLSERTNPAKSGHHAFAFRHPSLDFKFPTTTCPSTEGHDPGPSAPVPKSLLHRRQLSRMSKKSKDFNTQMPGRANSPEQPPDLMVKAVLAVPNPSMQPESPGFPKMLAKINFPSPPTTSRPSSRANSLSSKSVDLTSLCTPITPPLPSSGPTPPVIQPRTTSKRACITSTTPFSPSASLNEVMMRHALQSPHQAESADHPPTTGDASENVGTPSITADGAEMKDGSDPQMEPSMRSLGEGPAQNDDVGERSSGDLTPTVKATCRNSLESYTASDAKSQRQSTSSNITGTTDTNSQSAATYNSFRSSARSDITTSTFTTAKDGLWSPQPPSFRDSALSSGPLLLANSDELETTDGPTLGKGVKTVDEPIQDLESSHPTDTKRAPSPRCSTPTSPASFISQDDEELGPTRIIERRMARRAKVHEYKQRDLNAVRTSLRASWAKLGEASMDSPVLGWFPHEAHRPRLQNPSPLAQTAPWSTTFNDAASNGTDDEQEPANHLLKPTSRPTEENILPTKLTPPPFVQRREWTFSPIMVSAAIQAEEPESLVSKSELMVSDVMETVSINPNTESAEEESKRKQANRLSTLLLLESSPASLPTAPGSRASLRPMLKGRPLSRSKPAPITISRNPKTGAIERTITPPKPSGNGPYFMATPPKSSESLASPRRWSLPVRSISPTPPTSWEQPPSPRRGGYDTLEEDDEEDEADDERETKSRLDIVKERLQREKEEKDREISNIVARTVVPSPAPRIQEEEPEQQEPPIDEEGEGTSSNSVHEVERRLKRLEKNGDAWLRVMGPLLENMTKTLEAMQKDGVCSELKMSDFVIDMDAEARRYSMVSQNTPAAVKVAKANAAAAAAAAVTSNSSARTHSPAPNASPSGRGSPKGSDDTQRSQSASPSNWGSKDNGKKKRMGRGRSSSNLSRLRLQLDRAAKRSIDETSTLFARPRVDSTSEREGTRGEGQPGPHHQASASASAAPQPPPTPGSPTDHDLQVEMAIRRRIKQQEAEFDALMTKWGMPTPRRAVFTEDDKRRPALPTASSVTDNNINGDSSHKASENVSREHRPKRSEPLRPPRLELPAPRNSKSMNQLDAAAESPIDPMLRHVRRKSWPKPLPLDALGSLPAASAAAGSSTTIAGRRRSNTDLGPGGGDGSGVTRLMRSMGTPAPLLHTSQMG